MRSVLDTRRDQQSPRFGNFNVSGNRTVGASSLFGSLSSSRNSFVLQAQRSGGPQKQLKARQRSSSLPATDVVNQPSQHVVSTRPKRSPSSSAKDQSGEQTAYPLPNVLENELFRLHLGFLQGQHRVDTLQQGMLDFSQTLNKALDRAQQAIVQNGRSSAAISLITAKSHQDLDDEAFQPSPTSEATSSTSDAYSLLSDLLVLKSLYDRLMASAAASTSPLSPSVTTANSIVGIAEHGEHGNDVQSEMVEGLQRQVACLQSEVVLLQQQIQLEQHARTAVNSSFNRSSNNNETDSFSNYSMNDSTMRSLWIEELDSRSMHSLLPTQSINVPHQRQPTGTNALPILVKTQSEENERYSQSVINELTKHVVSLQEHRGSLIEELNKSTQIVEKIKRQENAMKTYIRELETKLLVTQHTNLSSSNEINRSSISELYSRCATTDQTNADLNLKNQALKRQIELLEQKLTIESKDKDTTVTTLRTKHIPIENEMNIVTAERVQLRQELLNQKAKYADLTEEFIQAQGALSRLHTTSQQDKELLKAENIKLKEQWKIERNKLEANILEMSSIKVNAAQTEHEKEMSGKEEVTQLIKQIDTLRQENDVLHRKLDQQTEQITVIQEQKTRAESNVTFQRDALQSARQRNEKLYGKVLEHEKAIQDVLRTVKSDSNIKLTELHHLLERSCDAERDLLLDNKTLQEQLSKTQQVAELAREEKDALQLQQKQLNDDNNHLKNNVRCATKAIEKTKLFAARVLAIAAEELDLQISPQKQLSTTEIDGEKTEAALLWMEQVSQKLVARVRHHKHQFEQLENRERQTNDNLQIAERTLDVWQNAWMMLAEKVDCKDQLSSASYEENTPIIMDHITQRLDKANSLVIEFSAKVNDLEEKVRRSILTIERYKQDKKQIENTLSIERQAAMEKFKDSTLLSSSVLATNDDGSTNSLAAVADNAHIALTDMRTALSNMNNFVSDTSNVWSAFIFGLQACTGFEVSQEEKFDVASFSAQCDIILDYIKQLQSQLSEQKTTLDECATEVAGSQQVFAKLTKSYSTVATRVHQLITALQLDNDGNHSVDNKAAQLVRLLNKIQDRASELSTELKVKERSLRQVIEEKIDLEGLTTAQAVCLEELRSLSEDVAKTLTMSPPSFKSTNTAKSLFLFRQDVVSAIQRLQSVVLEQQDDLVTLRNTVSKSDHMTQNQNTATLASLNTQLASLRSELRTSIMDKNNLSQEHQITLESYRAELGRLQQKLLTLTDGPKISTNMEDEMGTTITNYLLQTDSSDPRGRSQSRSRITTMTERHRSQSRSSSRYLS